MSQLCVSHKEQYKIMRKYVNSDNLDDIRLCGAINFEYVYKQIFKWIQRCIDSNCYDKDEFIYRLFDFLMITRRADDIFEQIHEEIIAIHLKNMHYIHCILRVGVGKDISDKIMQFAQYPLKYKEIDNCLGDSLPYPKKTVEQLDAEMDDYWAGFYDNQK